MRSKKMATNRTMYLYHVTHKNNWYPIGVHGLQREFSNGKMNVVWLVTEAKVQWAVDKISKRDGVCSSDLIAVKVRVRRHTLRRNRVAGSWYSKIDILPCRIEGTSFANEVIREYKGTQR